MMQVLKQTGTCNTCGNTDIEMLISEHDLLPDRVNVMKCPSCDLVFLKAGIGSWYFERGEGGYWDNAEQERIYLNENVQKKFEREHQKRLSKLEALTPEKGKLLDVGCGVGHFLATAERRGWTVQGLDIAPQAREAARTSYGLDVQVGTLVSVSLHHGTFDVLTLWDVIGR